MQGDIVIRRKCTVCGHNEPHRPDSQGAQQLIRCPMCPGEICGNKVMTLVTNVNIDPDASYFAELSNVVGIMPINEMSPRQLVEEIMNEQFNALQKFDTERLKAMVAQIRVHRAQSRIYREAGIEQRDWMWGGHW